MSNFFFTFYRMQKVLHSMFIKSKGFFIISILIFLCSLCDNLDSFLSRPNININVNKLVSKVKLKNISQGTLAPACDYPSDKARSYSQHSIYNVMNMITFKVSPDIASGEAHQPKKSTAKECSPPRIWQELKIKWRPKLNLFGKPLALTTGRRTCQFPIIENRNLELT